MVHRKPAPDSNRDAQALDWEAARRFLDSAVRHRLRGTATDQADDVVQEALIRTFRAANKEPVRNPEALMNTIADYAVGDFLRRHRRWNRYLTSLGQAALEVADIRALPEFSLGDPEERLIFVAQEFFASAGSPCREIADEVIGRPKRPWRDIGAVLTRSEVAVKQQWSRCLKRLEQAGRAHGELLLAWTALRGGR